MDEIPLVNTPASFEPALDYVVTKMPRFPFDKFADANQRLGTQMKATGEVMSIGRTFEESLLKAVRSLETGVFHLYMDKFDQMTEDVYKRQSGHHEPIPARRGLRDKRRGRDRFGSGTL